MKKAYLLFLGLVFVLSGCVTRTYNLTRDRVDQHMAEGNRGYIMGAHSGTEKPRKTERTMRVFEFELGKSYKIEEDKTSAESVPEPVNIIEYVPAADDSQDIEAEASLKSAAFQEYTVEKNDTLQKISQKFYGTTRNWTKIYEANKSVLKTPDRVYAGQVLNIPEEGMTTNAQALIEPVENLK
ncbi:MAG: LysM peptidoglycan-binding domain-containing protein [Candidatus Omnitrophota bacterium]|jgi:nucleoid-associated protein YgaU